MSAMHLKPKRNGKLSVAAVLASGALLTTGCGNMQTTAASTNSFNVLATSAGSVHGGNQPVSGATVYLYGAGQAGIGSAATLFATTTTKNDGYGSFSFNKMSGTTSYPNTGNTYSCGTGTDPEMYLVVKGGNTQNNGSTSVNSAAAFMAPLGYCSQISNSTFVDVTEVTTAATVAALAPFINPSTESVGNDGIAEAYVALNHAFQTIPLLVNAANGLAIPSTSKTGSTAGVGVSNVTITATPEIAKLNTVASILSSCINQQTSTSGTSCSTLFTNATPPASVQTTSLKAAVPAVTSFPAPTDTIQAALYMFLNPTDGSTTNRTNLFNLTPAAGGPYQPVLSAVPTDWTLGIAYTAAGSCPASSVTNGTSTTGAFISAPADINIDAAGNVWLANSANGSSTLAELSSNGTPTNCVVYGGQSKGGGVIDINGNSWFGDNSSNHLYRFNPTSGATLTYTTAAPPYAVTTDGSGNVFFSTTTGSVGSVYIIKDGADQTIANGPVLVSNTVGAFPMHLFPDAAGDVWVTSGSGFVTELTLQAGAPNGYANTQITVPAPSAGITVGAGNRVYVVSQDTGSSLTVLAPNGSGVFSVQSGFPTSANTGGLLTPLNVALDGAGNAWGANQSAGTSGNYGLAEISAAGTAISNSGTNGGYQKGSTYTSKIHAVAVDLSGNVWVTNDGTAAVTEYVGAGVPQYQPYSIGLQNGRFQSIP